MGVNNLVITRTRSITQTNSLVSMVNSNTITRNQVINLVSKLARPMVSSNRATSSTVKQLTILTKTIILVKCKIQISLINLNLQEITWVEGINRNTRNIWRANVVKRQGQVHLI